MGDPSQVCTTRVTLQNKHGLHARPAHLFVQTANAYAAKLTVGRTDGDERVDGKSIMAMMLARDCAFLAWRIIESRSDAILISSNMATAVSLAYACT